MQGKLEQAQRQALIQKGQELKDQLAALEDSLVAVRGETVMVWGLVCHVACRTATTQGRARLSEHWQWCVQFKLPYV